MWSCRRRRGFAGHRDVVTLQVIGRCRWDCRRYGVFVDGELSSMGIMHRPACFNLCSNLCIVVDKELSLAGSHG